MDTILRVIDVLVGLALIGVVLLQRSEGGGLGLGGGSSSNAFMSVRGTANFLTRVTGILAGLFMILSLVLVLLADPHEAQRSIFDSPGGSTPASTPAPVGTLPAPAAPAAQTPTPAPLPSAPQPGAPAPRGQ